MDAEELAETVLNPANRTLKQIQMEDAAEVSRAFMGLMGDSATYRKDFIEKNAMRANIDV